MRIFRINERCNQHLVTAAVYQNKYYHIDREESMKVVVVEKRWLRRMQLKHMVNRVVPDAEVACFKNCSGVMAYAMHQPVDVALLDMNTQQIQNLIMAGKLQEICPRLNIIFMTDVGDNWSCPPALYQTQS